MLKTLLTTALGLTAAATLTADAEGCRFLIRNNADQPVMAELVRNAHFIELVRVSSYSPLLPDARQFSPNVETYRYAFTIEETLKGELARGFDYLASTPFGMPAPPECDGIDDIDLRWDMPNCERHEVGEIYRTHAVETANGGRENWRQFYFIDTRYRNGNGGIGPAGHDSGPCSSIAESYEAGQTYLAFRDGQGAVIRTQQLNLQLIARSDDRWLEAVRYLIDNPDEDWLPAVAAEEYLSHFNSAGIMQVSACSRPVGRQFADFEPIEEITGDETARGNWRNHRSFPVSGTDNYQCREGDIFLSISNESTRNTIPAPPFLPIRDGMVDLSGIPSQHAIEPSQVPLTDVIAWLSEAPETETPQ